MLFLSSPAEHWVLCRAWAYCSPLITEDGCLCCQQVGEGAGEPHQEELQLVRRVVQPLTAEPHAAPRGGEEPGLWRQLPGQDLQHPHDPAASPAPVWSQQLLGLYQHQRSAWGTWGDKGEGCVGHCQASTGEMVLVLHSWYSFSIAPAGCAFSLCHPCPIPLLFF